MSRYRNYNKNEPYNVGWMDTSDHSKTGYVAKVERVVEHVIPVPVIGFVRTDYRYSSEPAQEELIREYGVDKLHSQLGSTYDYSETVESFLTKIQDEVSQPNNGNGFNSNWHARARPNSTVQDGIGTVKNGDDKDFIKGSNNNKVNIVPIGDKQEKGYAPMIISNSKDMCARPINEVPIVHNRPHRKPTNDINTAQAQGPNAAATLNPNNVATITSDDLIQRYKGAKVPW